MSNIIQAAKWMLDGKRVRRADWGKSSVTFNMGDLDECYVLDDLGATAQISAEELLAEDWEIAQ
jgi:hypothetical protein